MFSKDAKVTVDGSPIHVEDLQKIVGLSGLAVALSLAKMRIAVREAQFADGVDVMRRFRQPADLGTGSGFESEVYLWDRSGSKRPCLGVIHCHGDAYAVIERR